MHIAHSPGFFFNLTLIQEPKHVKKYKLCKVDFLYNKSLQFKFLRFDYLQSYFLLHKFSIFFNYSCNIYFLGYTLFCFIPILPV